MEKLNPIPSKSSTDKKELDSKTTSFLDFNDIKPFTEQPALFNENHLQPRINGHDLFSAFTTDIRDTQSVYFR
ncbi:MAG: hypothetical protein ABIX01_06690 [Chitinophagaceae bacterium]